MKKILSSPCHLVETWEAEKTACGRDALGLNKTEEPDFVTCKNCKRHVRRLKRFKAAACSRAKGA